MTKVLFRVTANPFLLATTLIYHIRKYESKYPDADEALSENIYIDDLISGSENEREVDMLRTNVKRISSEAKFSMRKWAINSVDLQNKWKEDAKFKISK